MHNTMTVGPFQTFANFNSILEQLFRGERSPAQTIGQRLAFQIFHDQIIDSILVADVVQRANVRMT